MSNPTSSNPFAAPPAAPKMLSPPQFTLLRGFAIVGLSGLICGILGALVGLTLGVATPAYYRGVFSAGNNPDFIPWQVGLGLGLTQGIILGAVVGAVVVLAVAWYESRRAA